MHADDAVIDLATTPQPLPCGTHGIAAALGRPRFIKAADRFRMTLFAGHQALAVVTDGCLFPLDRFQETL